MKRFSILTTVVIAALFLTAGCSKDGNPASSVQPTQDRQEIQAVLEASEYALPDAFNSDQGYEGQGVLGENEARAVNEGGVDVLPWVRFFRIERVKPTVEYIIELPGSGGEGTADVRVTHRIIGTFVVDNTQDQIINPFLRQFTSVARRFFTLRKTEEGWRIEKISPVDILSTNDGGTTIHIAGIGARGSSGTYPEVRLMSPDTLLAPDELPRFAPGDTMLVAARAASSAEDGCWLFLHAHGGCYGPHSYEMHRRVPFVRDSSDPTMFFARVVLPETPTVPRVIHVAVDGIGWNTLFGDETAVYNSRMWALPCVLAP